MMLDSVALVACVDESHLTRHHPILGVGGFVIDGRAERSLEKNWRRAKRGLGLDPFAPVRYARSWEDKAKRLPLIQEIPRLEVPVKAVAALLEDSRPPRMREEKKTRKDMYVHKEALGYVLQRLSQPQYFDGDADGPHRVVIDQHDDFREYDEVYVQAHRRGWKFAGGRSLPPLATLGFLASPVYQAEGPMIEIADLVCSVSCRWFEAQVAVERGRTPIDLAELDAAMLALLPLFPRKSPTSLRWRGYSVISHRSRGEGELMHSRIDMWLHGLMRRHAVDLATLSTLSVSGALRQSA
jgi:hypothetical protein